MRIVRDVSLSYNFLTCFLEYFQGAFISRRRMAARRMRSALHAWRDETASLAAALRAAERLHTAAKTALLARCYHDWRAHTETERRSRKALRQAEAQAASVRKAQVQVLE